METEELRSALAELYLQCDTELKTRFDRSLPFADGLFDRWERARRLGFGEGSSIYNSALVFGDTTVGDQTWIGPFVLLDGTGGLNIGSFCSIAAGVHIYTHDTVLRSLSRGQLPTRRAPVAIEDCCYVGSQSVIAADVTIGTQSVVAAKSFVNNSVPPRTIVAGTPARKIGEVRVEGKAITLDYGH